MEVLTEPQIIDVRNRVTELVAEFRERTTAESFAVLCRECAEGLLVMARPSVTEDEEEDEGENLASDDVIVEKETIL